MDVQPIIDDFQATIDELNGVKEVLQTLPARISHSAMLQLGPHAFVRGRLVHTNEVLCPLKMGANKDADLPSLSVWKSASEAVAHIDTRVKAYEKLMQDTWAVGLERGTSVQALVEEHRRAATQAELDALMKQIIEDPASRTPPGSSSSSSGGAAGAAASSSTSGSGGGGGAASAARRNVSFQDERGAAMTGSVTELKVGDEMLTYITEWEGEDEESSSSSGGGGAVATPPAPAPPLAPGPAPARTGGKTAAEVLAMLSKLESMGVGSNEEGEEEEWSEALPGQAPTTSVVAEAAAAASGSSGKEAATATSSPRRTNDRAAIDWVDAAAAAVTATAAPAAAPAAARKSVSFGAGGDDVREFDKGLPAAAVGDRTASSAGSSSSSGGSALRGVLASSSGGAGWGGDGGAAATSSSISAPASSRPPVAAQPLAHAEGAAFSGRVIERAPPAAVLGSVVERGASGGGTAGAGGARPAAPGAAPERVSRFKQMRGST